MADEELSLRLPKSPRRVGIEYAAVIAVIGIIIGVVVMPERSVVRNDNFDHGFKLGLALAPALAIAFAIGYFRQKRRQRS